MKVEMISCDNPDCDEVTYDAYGWIVGPLTYIGSGPTLEIEVCCEECIAPGLEFVRQRAEYEEHEKRRSYEAEMDAMITRTPCSTCGVTEGGCRTKFGTPAPQPHAPRRDAARVRLHAATVAEDEQHQGDDREDDEDGPEHARGYPLGGVI